MAEKYPHKIKAIRDTLLKKEPEQSSVLAAGKLRQVKANTVYFVEDFKPAKNGHFWVRLGHNAGEWYIFDGEVNGHWETSWETGENDSTLPLPNKKPTSKPSYDSINWADGSQKISKYFTVAEVTKNEPRRRPKKGSREEKNILALAIQLDKIRESWGGPIGVTSWYRPPAVNQSVGGVSNSQHINGGAADIRPVKGSIWTFQQWLDSNWYGALGYGATNGFVHVDIRNGKGFKSGGSKGSRWHY